MQFKPIFHKRKGTYYRLIDEYTDFYLKWIEPLKGGLQMHALDKGVWQEMRKTPAWVSWMGYAFESVCYKHLIQIRRAAELPATAVADSWRYVPKKNQLNTVRKLMLCLIARMILFLFLKLKIQKCLM